MLPRATLLARGQGVRNAKRERVGFFVAVAGTAGCSDQIRRGGVCNAAGPPVYLRLANELVDSLLVASCGDQRGSMSMEVPAQGTPMSAWAVCSQVVASGEARGVVSNRSQNKHTCEEKMLRHVPEME